MTATQQTFFKHASARRWISDNFPTLSDSWFNAWYDTLPEKWEHLSGNEIVVLVTKLKTIRF